MTLPVLDLPADPFARGRAHGRAMAERVAANVATYLARFEAGGIDRDTARREGSAWAAFIRADNADYFREMEGIADGADLPVADVAMLTARYEITYANMRDETFAAEREPDGCTAFGLMPEVTAHGGTLIGQNWDWLKGLRGNTLVVRVREGDHPAYVGFTEAGIPGCKVAVNAHGIGLCVNGLVSADDGVRRRAKPLHVRCREVIEARRFDRALLPLLATGRVCSASITVGQADGEVMNLELTPDAHQVLWPDDGILTHANHMRHPASAPSRIERLSPSTLFRDRRVERALRRAAPRITQDSIVAALSDHFSHPASVCRHPDALVPEAKQNVTVAGIIIDLDARQLIVSDGPPCETPLVAYDIDPAAARAAPTAAVAKVRRLA